MFKIRNMMVEDVETVARMDALDYDNDPEKGYKEAREHSLDHLKIVPQHCYVIENENREIIAAMVLHPRENVFEIEDFHVRKSNATEKPLHFSRQSSWNTWKTFKQKSYAALML